jgi:hypothetical protein
MGMSVGGEEYLQRGTELRQSQVAIDRQIEAREKAGLSKTDPMLRLLLFRRKVVREELDSLNQRFLGGE